MSSIMQCYCNIADKIPIVKRVNQKGPVKVLDDLERFSHTTQRKELKTLRLTP